MKHLTEWEQNEWLLGDRSPAAAEHLRLCAECRELLKWIESGFHQFRAASRNWADARAEAGASRLLPKRAAPRPFVRTWAAGCAAAALAAAIGLVELHPHPATHSAAPNGAASLSDDALLEQIDQQVSGNVPRAMQPLARYTAPLEGAAR